MAKRERLPTDRGGKSIIGHVADTLIDPEAASDERVVHGSTTDAGKPVEEQVRKKWDPKKKGLPTFLERG